MRLALVLVLACNRAEAPPVEIAPVVLPSASVAHEEPPDAAPEPVASNVALSPKSGDANTSFADPPSDGVQRVIAASRSKLRNCYNQKLKTDPTASGKVVYSLRIAPNGTVASTSMVSNTFSDMDVATCIEQVLRSLRFPSGQGTTVQIPFLFTSGMP